jgi:hypothetical protein
LQYRIERFLDLIVFEDLIVQQDVRHGVLAVCSLWISLTLASTALTACRALSQPVVVFGGITRFLGWGLRSGKRLCMVAVRKWTGLDRLLRANRPVLTICLLAI